MKELTDGGVETFKLDVTKSEEIQEIKAKISEMSGGSLDLLVNNAGVYYQSAFSDTTMTRIREEMEVNFFAVADMIHTFLPLLLKSNDARILLMGSVAYVAPTPFYSIYNASKAALAQLGNTLRVELAPFNIKVIQTVTGPVKSNILKPATLPAGSLYAPVKSEYENANRDIFGKAAIPLEPFADQLATEVLKQNPKAIIWSGANALPLRMLTTLSHATGMDWILSNLMGLHKMPKRQMSSKEG